MAEQSEKRERKPTVIGTFGWGIGLPIVVMAASFWISVVIAIARFVLAVLSAA